MQSPLRTTLEATDGSRPLQLEVHDRHDEVDPSVWDGPTLHELADRVEHQFGEAPAMAGIYTLGFGRDEPLSPCDIHLVCDLLGLPAEDFGVDV